MEELTAERIGAKAFADGKPAVPALDAELNALLVGKRVGEGERLIRAWIKGFVNAPLAEEA